MVGIAGVAIAGVSLGVSVIGLCTSAGMGATAADKAEKAAEEQKKESTKNKEASIVQAKINMRQTSLQMGKEMLGLKDARLKSLSATRRAARGAGNPSHIVSKVDSSTHQVSGPVKGTGLNISSKGK